MSASTAFDECSFLAALKERREDEFLQSTPIKRHRAEIREDESKKDEEVEVFDSTFGRIGSIPVLNFSGECEGEEIEVFDTTYGSISSTKDNEHVDTPVMKIGVKSSDKTGVSEPPTSTTSSSLKDLYWKVSRPKGTRKSSGLRRWIFGWTSS
ncbi:uncharacterized protein [Montipora foliosa]|uniref:uncharacterized protein n=1 Tax=Montipora foliosa TaxID=591990 RepID=UPI0035F180EA